MVILEHQQTVPHLAILLLTGFALLAVSAFSSSADGTNRETRQRKSMSHEVDFLFKCISIVLVNFKAKKPEKAH